MIMTNKLLPVALIAALIGGSVGALVMHSRSASATDQPAAVDTSRNADVQYASAANQTDQNSYVPAEFDTAGEQTAYKTGFADGFSAAQGGVTGSEMTSGVYSRPRVVYRNSTRSPRRVYYDYQRPKGRSFWQKHRDKLTVAMGTGGGAIIGGLIGGKKGAAIGALSGAGGSALYTYKLRNRDRRY